MPFHFYAFIIVARSDQVSLRGRGGRISHRETTATERLTGNVQKKSNDNTEVAYKLGKKIKNQNKELIK